MQQTIDHLKSLSHVYATISRLVSRGYSHGLQFEGCTIVRHAVCDFTLTIVFAFPEV